MIAVVLLSFPSGVKMGDPARWRDPRTKAQFALWAQRLRSFGWAISDQGLEDQLWGASQRYLRVRSYVVAPFEPYGQVVPQFWGMFKAPSLTTTTIRIEVESGERPAFATVYESRSPEHTFLASTLDHNRMRKQIGRVGTDEVLFKAMSRWLAGRAFDAYPDAKRVRVSVLRRESPGPEARRAGLPVPERIQRKVVLRRDELP